MKLTIIGFLMATLPATAQVKITPGAGSVRIEIGGKPFSEFFVSGADVTKPYLHPLLAASGTRVTRLFPMEKVAGEPVDHPHQRSMWFAHDSVNGVDFWNNEAGYTKPPRRGKIVLAKMGQIKSGAKQGSIAATFDWIELEGEKKLLTEERVMTFYSDPNLRIVDFDITLTAAQPVKFGDAKDGLFGIRIHPDLQETQGSGKNVTPGTGKLENAEGLLGEKQVWGKPSNWCDYFGAIKGEKLGIAILDHPGNPHHPVRWHARGYGLFAANPFGLAVFTGDKSQDGGVTVEPGGKLRFRYRMVIHPGDARSADIAGIYAKYAAAK